MPQNEKINIFKLKIYEILVLGFYIFFKLMGMYGAPYLTVQNIPIIVYTCFLWYTLEPIICLTIWHIK